MTNSNAIRTSTIRATMTNKYYVLNYPIHIFFASHKEPTSDFEGKLVLGPKDNHHKHQNRNFDTQTPQAHVRHHMTSKSLLFPCRDEAAIKDDLGNNLNLVPYYERQREELAAFRLCSHLRDLSAGLDNMAGQGVKTWSLGLS